MIQQTKRDIKPYRGAGVEIPSTVQDGRVIFCPSLKFIRHCTLHRGWHQHVNHGDKCRFQLLQF